MREKKFTWHKIAASVDDIDFREHAIAEVVANGRTVCIIKKQDGLFACTQQCPHAGGSMAVGYVDAAGNIVCPLHRYKFDLVTGRNISGEGYYLKTFPVEIRNEGIFIGFEENRSF